MDIKWGALGEVFGVSFGVTVVLVALFAVGAAALAGPRRPEEEGEVVSADGTPAAAIEVGAAARAIATLCFAVCAATVLYGLYLVISK